jgi:hypothetical protein
MRARPACWIEKETNVILWDSNDTQFCEGCGLYHYRDECTDVYFNDPTNWK